MMNREIKKKWLEALRSGNYKQGSHRLRDGNTFCCLGVLCDIIDPDGWRKFEGQYYHGESSGVLPKPICSICEIQEDPHVDVGGGMKYSLASVNDGVSIMGVVTFKTIADLIEKQF